MVIIISVRKKEKKSEAQSIFFLGVFSAEGIVSKLEFLEEAK